MKPLVSVWDVAGTALIIPCPSGVRYSNQTGGTSCLQPELEGVLAPLGNDVDLDGKLLGPQADLADYFEGPKHRGAGATGGLDDADAAFIDGVLQHHRLEYFVVVDRSRLRESHEAWVHVQLLCDGDRLEGFGPYPRPAVLTWMNSD